MNEALKNTLKDIAVDKTNLYREENITDLKVATIQRLVPIKADGSDDASRETIYIAQTSIMTQGGPLPLQAEIKAKGLEEALDQFPEAIEQAMQRLMEQAEAYQREQASRIVTPGQLGMGGGLGGMPQGGRGGRGGAGGGLII